ncbi:MAG: SDR family NAD(P)-dependent oxidoreductase, partial [Paracoccaceae bacterium]
RCSVRFEGRVVMISGAASGFGRLAATRFSGEGALLSLSDVDGDGLDAVAREIPGALARKVDVSREDDQADWVSQTLARFGKLDIALNNAGVGSPMAPITATPVDEFDRMMAINAKGVFLGLKHQIPAMRQGGGGAILNTASAAGILGAGHLSAYAAAKHAVVGLTRAAADEVARHNIRVNAICPSFATTPLFDDMADEVAEARGEDRDAAYARISARVPMRRVASPEEVVTVMLSLCDPANTFMTGQAIAVDGGLSAI